MGDKIVITAAIAGSVTMKEHNPAVPYTPEEFVREARQAEEAGAAAVHVHFRDPATGLPIGSTDNNLKAAIAGETHEYTDMYPGMAKTAREEGFDEIADWFETLAKAERSHANRFQKALDNLDA